MAQTRVFSWKIGGDKYGYLHIPGKSGAGLITNRITDEAVLTEISNEVSSWSESEYTTKFNALNNEIRNTFNLSIPGSASDYYNGYTKNYIVLTGKDGGYLKKENNVVSAEVVENIKKIVKAELASAKTELVAESSAIKDTTISSVNNKITNATAEIASLKEELIANENLMSSKLDSAQSKIETAAMLFDMNGTGVNKQNLQNAISKSNTAIERLNIADNKIAAQEISLERTNQRISNETASINERINTVSTETSNIGRAINTLNETVNELNIKVERVTSAHVDVSQQEQAQESLRKSMTGSEDEIAITETIDNGDGSFNVNTRIGNEDYNVKIYGFGGKIKVREVEDGLVLATNGFRYKDKSGSVISMINGNILLSNADGSGKLEIKKDGLYINGTKQ